MTTFGCILVSCTHTHNVMINNFQLLQDGNTIMPYWYHTNYHGLKYSFILKPNIIIVIIRNKILWYLNYDTISGVETHSTVIIWSSAVMV